MNNIQYWSYTIDCFFGSCQDTDGSVGNVGGSSLWECLWLPLHRDRMEASIRKQVDSDNLTGVLYIDLFMAFDTIGHSLSLNKLPSVAYLTES